MKQYRRRYVRDDYDEDDSNGINFIVPYTCMKFDSIGDSLKYFGHLIEKAFEEGCLGKVLPKYIDQLKITANRLEDYIEQLEKVRENL